MSDLLTRRLALLNTDTNRVLLGKGKRGIERETLRVNRQGNLALTPHPVSLGSALTHPFITTDYSESLLEFITPAEHDIAEALKQLDAVHRFAYTKLLNELLWSQSMPCHLPSEETIPIAYYGNSHIGKLKHIYRRGLALRYGKTMQCIAGIHYNFSLAEELWSVLQSAERAPESAIQFQSESYIALIRNFHRYSWLLMYLFGASPALSAQFLRGRSHQLDVLSNDTLYLPYATSLRMSDLGYQSNAQAGIIPPYNSLADYMTNLTRAVRQPYPAYVAMGTKRDGEWIQINTNVLQVENEFYSTIRPKRIIMPGERPIEALRSRGVQYIEVRCLDIDPFEPLGINLETARFLDAFLLFCAFDKSDLTSDAEGKENTANFASTVKEGRRPGLVLQRTGNPIELKTWGLELLMRISAAANLLDSQHNDAPHGHALNMQRKKLEAPELTPSARVLAELSRTGDSFINFSLRQSELHATYFKERPLSSNELSAFNQLTQTSLENQQKIEANQTGDLDEFIEAYQTRIREDVDA